ncbi:MAG: type VI secretion system baseplate subunit TssE [Chitinivibrionales bacterium]|nr:type VI secretion system baseplate subunit TssE [Chitinivibrionales bacterium]
MNQALFESITGRFLDGTELETVPVNQRLIPSIIDNLSRIFNTRLGSIPHLKEYGLPDISDVYQKMPHGIDELRDAIKKSVERYEPRLKNVKVQLQDQITAPESRLTFILSVEIRGIGPVRFQTTFFTTGHSTISPWKK